MPHVIRIVPDVVFPIPPLPDAPFSAQFVAVALHSFGQAAGKTGFDQPPSRGKIAISHGQFPDAVHLMGQHNPSINIKRSLGLGLAHRFAQSLNLIRQDGSIVARHVHSEKDRRAADIWSQVIWHIRLVPCCDLTLGKDVFCTPDLG